MKIPVEWLKQYIKTDKTSKELGQSFTSLGLMLDKPVFEYQEGPYKTDILDVEHRMDRSDWLSITGCARDLAAFENISFSYPELYTELGKTPEKDQIVDIQVTCPDMVNRFNTRVIRNIKVTDSPAWLKNRLQAYGIPSINNIVDITNYVMVELGQPMHAQDLAKMEKQEIVIRKARKGETITTLLGETVNLDEENFVLTQNDKPTVLGGIVGGKSTGIDASTKDIIIDAGNYNQVVIRKASRKLKIQNETVSRYDKFLHPELCEVAIQRAVKLILDLAGGYYYQNIDWYPNPVTAKKFNLRFERIEKLGGITFDHITVKRILNSLGYVILNENEVFLEVKVPYYRTDIEVEDDIVADVLRINGYDQIPVKGIDTAPPGCITPPIYNYEQRLRQIMVTLGAHEHITDPLTSLTNNKSQISMQNSQSMEKNALRISIQTTLEPVIDQYKKNSFSKISLFEIGKTYFKDEVDKPVYANYHERRELQFVQYQEAGIVTQSISTKSTLSTLFKELGIKDYEIKHENNDYVIYVKNVALGNISYNAFNLFIEELIKIPSEFNRATTKLPYKYKDDISILVGLDTDLGPICKHITESNTEVIKLETDIIPVNNRKNALITIKHNIENFAGFKNALKETLSKNYKDLEFKS